jgi:hypothetical protein
MAIKEKIISLRQIADPCPRARDAQDAVEAGAT